MLKNFSADWMAWWETVTPEFAFLLALPFAVAAVGLAADCVRRRRRKG
jgi:hypothetical protein